MLANLENLDTGIYTTNIIRDIGKKRNRETNCFSNDLHDALLCESGKDFWRSWNSTFVTKKVISQVGGINYNTTIAINFTTRFEYHCQPSTTERNDTLKSKYEESRVHNYGNPIRCSVFRL